MRVREYGRTAAALGAVTAILAAMPLRIAGVPEAPRFAIGAPASADEDRRDDRNDRSSSAGRDRGGRDGGSDQGGRAGGGSGGRDGSDRGSGRGDRGKDSAARGGPDRDGPGGDGATGTTAGSTTGQAAGASMGSVSTSGASGGQTRGGRTGSGQAGRQTGSGQADGGQARGSEEAGTASRGSAEGAASVQAGPQKTGAQKTSPADVGAVEGGRTGPAAAEGPPAGSPLKVVRVERDGKGMRVVYSNRVREEIAGGQYALRDAEGRVVIERPATAADVDRVRENVRRSGLPATADTGLPSGSEVEALEAGEGGYVVRYREGWAESLKAGRYLLEDPDGNTVVERAATMGDHNRLQALVSD